MIITDTFVWINYPKTGSTFVREVLREIYPNQQLSTNKKEVNNITVKQKFESFFKNLRIFNKVFMNIKPNSLHSNKDKWMIELTLPETRPGSGDRLGKPTPHGTVSQIPKKYSRLPVISSIRDPVNRYLSAYKYGDWKKSDQLPTSFDIIRSEFPDFPELDFENFLLYLNRFYKIGQCKIGGNLADIGPLSLDFLRFFTNQFFTNSNKIEFINLEEIENHIKKITFLKCSNLNMDLYHFLINNGFNHSKISYIIEKQPINESNKSLSISEEHIKFIRDQEWLIYKLFTEF